MLLKTQKAKFNTLKRKMSSLGNPFTPFAFFLSVTHAWKSVPSWVRLLSIQDHASSEVVASPESRLTSHALFPHLLSLRSGAAAIRWVRSPLSPSKVPVPKSSSASMWSRASCVWCTFQHRSRSPRSPRKPRIQRPPPPEHPMCPPSAWAQKREGREHTLFYGLSSVRDMSPFSWGNVSLV